MIRQLTLAAVLAVAATAPANAESIRITTAGKTPQELHVEIRKAARTLCDKEAVGATLFMHAYASCVDNAVANAKAQLTGDKLAVAKAQKLASR